MIMRKFTYTEGTSAFIDFLCRSNKISLLSDRKDYTVEEIKFIEGELEYPAEDIIVLKPRVNISSYGFKKITTALGDISRNYVLMKEEVLTRNIFYKFNKPGALYESLTIYIPWQILVEVIKDFDIISYLDPLQMK